MIKVTIRECQDVITCTVLKNALKFKKKTNKQTKY